MLVGRLCDVFAKQVVGKLRCSTQMCILSVTLNSCMAGVRRPRFISEHICTLTRPKGLKDLTTSKNTSVSSLVDSLVDRDSSVELVGRLSIKNIRSRHTNRDEK